MQRSVLPQPRAFELITEQQDGEVRLLLAGELDISTAGQVEEEVEKRFEEAEPRLLVFDLRELTFIDSVGLRTIFDVDARCREHGTRLVLVQAPPKVQRTFEVTGLNSLLTMVEDPSDL